jgi:hypothetical protein
MAYSKARSFFIYDYMPARVVQAICEDKGPGLTVIRITTTKFCLMPPVKGLRLLIADSTAEMSNFNKTTGHSITWDIDSVYTQSAYLFKIRLGVAGLAAYCL